MRTFIRFSLIGLVVALSTSGKSSAGTPPQSESPNGNFTFDFPSGWQEKTIPGLKTKAVVGPASKGFAPNINIVSEEYKGTLDAYAKLSFEQLFNVMPGFNLLKQSKFKTKDGLEGIRMITESQPGGKNLRQTFYLFDNGGKKYVVTCTALADDGDKLDSAFDTSMKTFKFKKK